MLIILASYESHAIKYKIIIIKLICKSSMTMLSFKGIKNCGILKKGHILKIHHGRLKRCCHLALQKHVTVFLVVKTCQFWDGEKKKQGGNERHFSSHKMKSYMCAINNLIFP